MIEFFTTGHGIMTMGVLASQIVFYFLRDDMHPDKRIECLINLIIVMLAIIAFILLDKP